MNQPLATPGYGVGGCVTCRQVFLVTPEGRTCPLCDGPPLQILEFPTEGPVSGPYPVPEPEAEPGPETPTEITVTCPHCDQLVILHVSEDEVAVIAPSAAPQEEPLVAPATEDGPPAAPLAEEEEPQEPLAGPHLPPPEEPPNG